MSVLDLNEAKRRTQEITAFAERPENWYHVGKSPWIPGRRPEFVLVSFTVRAVFSWTADDGEVYRHLSVSNVGPKYPNPVVIWTLAHYFGFQGAKVDEQGIVHDPSPSWGVDLNENDRCITVLEKINLA